jgi:type II secretory pathway pseudopilin PulG
MRPNGKGIGNRALTLVETLVVIVMVGFFVLLLLPSILPRRSYRHSPRIQCVSNLKQLALAFEIYAGDNNDHYPTLSIATNISNKEPGAQVLVPICQLMAFPISNSKILACPADVRQPATNFSSLRIENISYFLSLDAKEGMTNAILGGDRNLESGGQPVKSGLFILTTNLALSWTKEMHSKKAGLGGGNLMMVDGSVAEVGKNFDDVVRGQELTTNRLIVP